MATCFLFAQHFTDESCLSLRIDEHGTIDAPLERRTIEAFRAMQDNARTIVVLPAGYCSLYQVELPWLNDQKARAAIPYALEEQIAQQVSSVHVAFDKAHYQQGKYLVTVIDKLFLQDLISRLDALFIDFEEITLDWFALRDGEVCVSETSLLVNDPSFKGALDAEPAAIYLADRSNDSPVLLFGDSSPAMSSILSSSGLTAESMARVEGAYDDWVARRLLNARFMNLCQGEMRHNTRKEINRRWYYAAAALAGFWLVLVLVMNGIVSHQLTKKIMDLDQKTAVVYREFFPHAHQVISPRFRVGQLLKSGHGGQNAALWQLSDALAAGLKQGAYTIEQMRYQNQTLAVTLLARDFAELERLQGHLQQAGVKVTQSQAASHKQHVTATLELRL